MNFDYFYGEQSEQYAFYRTPKVFYTDERFRGLSSDAKTVYGILLDRVSLSAKNGWADEEGRVYVYMTVSSIEEAMGCAHQKACGLLSELEEFGLIERKKQGLGKPDRIYVKNFIQVWNSNLKKYENHTSESMEIIPQEVWKSASNNTDKNNTKDSNTHSILSDEEEERRSCATYFADRLQIEWLKETYPYDRDMIDEIYELIIDTVCSHKKTIRIAGDYKPVSIVKSQFMKLDNTHIQFVLDGLKENTTQVRCIKQYLLAALYNAPLTISSYYQALVNHDMATGRI
jgi:hypothetical protein